MSKQPEPARVQRQKVIQRPEMFRIGQGHIDYKPVLAAASRAGVKHFFVEQDPPMVGMTALEAAAIDYRYLRSII